MAYEKALQEFRQVRHVVGGQGVVAFGSMAKFEASDRYIYHSLQQRWKVADTTRQQYAPPLNGPPDSKADEFMGVIDGRPMWQPMRFVWRDLPVVSEEEAQQDSQ